MILATLVNLVADCLWMTLLTFGFNCGGSTATVAETPRGQLPSEIDLAEVQAGRMTVAEFHARMAARL